MDTNLFLPIDDVIPAILKGLAENTRLIVAAPPGAGKTTRIPLALLDQDWAQHGKIIMLEPRRIAARAAATRMAQTLGEKVGETIGLRARFDVRTSKKTRIEVMTEGVFTRMLLDDPELSDVSAILFDEFHERSLDADFGLALAMEVQDTFREDLRICPMSATLDTGTLSQFLKAKIIESDGRAHPVDTIYLDPPKNKRLEENIASAIQTALKEQDGSLLVFLPGMAEIKRVESLLNPLSDDICVTPLYGGLSPKEQDDAIRPAPKGIRKIVLATDIAESSITIEDVRIVIDSGLARIPRYDPQLNASRLETVKAARANIDQRRGRAGRTQAGVCYRLWHDAGTRGRPSFPMPEILNTDLSNCVLDLARWGTSDPSSTQWLTPPPTGIWKSSVANLQKLGALDRNAKLTEMGQHLSHFPLPPAHAAMILKAAHTNDTLLAAQIAALISERGAGGNSVDARDRLTRFQTATNQRAKNLSSMAKRWASLADKAHELTSRENAGRVIASGFPARIARARPGKRGEFLMANGRAARIDENDPLASHSWLAIADLTGAGSIMRITLAAPLDESDAVDIGQAITEDLAIYDLKLGRLTAYRTEHIGAITLSKTQLPKPSGDIAYKGLVQAIHDHGLKLLPAFDAIAVLAERIDFLHQHMNDDWPSDFLSLLQQDLENWLPPILSGAKDFQSISISKTLTAATSLLDWQKINQLNTLAPENWTTPTKRQVPINYASENGPTISVKAQEFFGLQTHPTLVNGRIPLTLEMLSPAQRPIATTKDIVSFWQGGYQDMRKDMRGRYPKHDWPEDPANARPQIGTKNRPRP